jgi:pimeloyl-[acyl-carrier protein] synthase
MVGEEIASRRRSPREDFLTALLNASAEGERLSEKEMLGICHVLLTAGHETTVNSMVTGLVAWAENPRQRELYLSGAVDGMAAIGEMMRYSAMSTLQRKIVLQDFDWHGKRLRRGEVVWLFVAAANRDPRVFESPDVMDVTRAHLDQVMTFGPGIHHCVGHHLAKIQLDEFFRVFLPAIGHIEILDRPLAQLPSMTFRGLSRLRVRLSAAPTPRAA